VIRRIVHGSGDVMAETRHDKIAGPVPSFPPQMEPRITPSRTINPAGESSGRHLASPGLVGSPKNAAP